MSNKKNVTWGGRFEKALHPLVAQFQASIYFDHCLYEVDIAGSTAHAQMLAKQGLITDEECQKIVDGLHLVKTNIAAGQLAWNVNLEDIHMHVEQALQDQIGDVAKKLHTGRSRNDQVALDLRMFVREAIDENLRLLKEVDVVLKKLMQQHQDHLMPGYTHLQQAQPVSLGAYFGAYQAMFERDQTRLEDCRVRMNFSPLGAGALAGSRLPLDRMFVAAALNFDGVIENTLDAVSDRDFAMEFLFVASVIMVHISRLSEDLILWATSEFSFLNLDDAFSTGSSLMPQKKNPDVSELMRGKSARVFGDLMAFLALMKGLPLAYNKDMQEDKESLFDAIDTLKVCLTILPLYLQSLNFDLERMQAAVEDSDMDAVFWVEELVKKGIPFRTAHEQVGEWVKEAVSQGKRLKEIAKMHF